MGFANVRHVIVAVLLLSLLAISINAETLNSTSGTQQASEALPDEGDQQLHVTSNSTDFSFNNITQQAMVNMPTSYEDTLPRLPHVELNVTRLRSQLFQAESKVFRRLSARHMEAGIRELQELAAILDTILPQAQGRQYFIGLKDLAYNTTALNPGSQYAPVNSSTTAGDDLKSFAHASSVDANQTVEQLQKDVSSPQQSEQMAATEGNQVPDENTTSTPDFASPEPTLTPTDTISTQQVSQQTTEQQNILSSPDSLPEQQNMLFDASGSATTVMQALPERPTSADQNETTPESADAAEDYSTDVLAGVDSAYDHAANETSSNSTDLAEDSSTDASFLDGGNIEQNTTDAENTTAANGIFTVRWAQLGDHAVIVGAEASAAALFDLAVLASTGVAEPHVKRNPLWAHLALHRAAAFDSLEAQMSLADRYFFGRGVKANCSIGMRFAKIAGKTVVAAAEKDASNIEPFMPVRLRERWMRADYFNHDEFHNSQAMVMMEEDMAGRGNVEAQRRLAYRRLVGQGVDADPAGAFRDFQAAAAHGDPYAIFNLGFMYLRGVHVATNTTTAKHYFEAAAKKGLAAGYNGVGVLHYNGHGMPRNITAAKEAFEKGAALDNPDCLFNLGTLYQNYEMDNTRALHYFERAYAEGHWRAGYNLALLHDESDVGKGCEVAKPYILDFIQDKKNWQHEMKYAVKAVDYGDYYGALVRYLIVAEQGSEVAASNAAWILLQKQGYTGARAGDLAASLLKRSASYNSSEGLVQLGNLCLEEESGLQAHNCSAQQAAELYAQATAMGSVEGMLSLAWMHWHGLGVDGNVSRAGELYKIAYKSSIWNRDGMAAILALWGFRLGSLLSYLLGQNIVLQLLDAITSAHQEMAYWVADLLTSPQAEGAGVMSGLADLGDVVQIVTKEMQADPEMLTVGILLGALVLVLWLRRHQQAQLQQRQMAQQFFTMPEADQGLAAGVQQPGGQMVAERQGEQRQEPPLAQALIQQQQQQQAQAQPQQHGIGLIQAQ